MYAVGRLGSYISQGVYTVSGPFHPFGGAVDIIVVEQQDGSFKSSPWYVRFGKFQGVLKTKEKVVNICVDGVEAGFHMYLDHKGEAYFLKEVDVEEEGESSLYPSSSGEETDGQSSHRTPLKSKSCNFDAREPDLVGQLDGSNGKIVTRTGSRRSRMLGLVFGRRSVKENSFRKDEDGPGIMRASSLERAEFAADLLEVRWSTNLAKPRKDKASRFSASHMLDGEADKDLRNNGGESQVTSISHDSMENNLDHPVLHDEIESHNGEMGNSCKPGFQESECSVRETRAEVSCLSTPKQAIETSTAGGSSSDEKCEVIPTICRNTSELSVGNADPDETANSVISKMASSDSCVSGLTELGARPSKQFNDEQVLDEWDAVLPDYGVSKEETGMDRVQSFIYCETSESSRLSLDGSGEETHESLYVSHGECGKVHVHAQILHETTEQLSEVNSLPESRVLVAKESSSNLEYSGDGDCCNFLNNAMIHESEVTSMNSAKNNIITESLSFINKHLTTSNSVKAEVLEVIHQDTVTKGLSEGKNMETEVVEVRENHSQRMNPSNSCMPDYNGVELEEPPMVPESYTQKVSIDPILGSVEVELRSICTTSSFSNSVQGQDKKKTGDEYNISELQPSDEVSVSSSENSEEEQFLFSDHDDLKLGDVQCVESHSPDHVQEGIEAVNESLNTDYVSHSSSNEFAQENLPNDFEHLGEKSRKKSSPICIPGSHKVSSVEVGRLVESLPNMWSQVDDLGAHDLCRPCHSLDSNSKSLEQTLLRNNVSSSIKSDADKEHKLAKEQPTVEDTRISGELNNVLVNPAVELSLCKHLLHEGMGADAASQAFDAEKLDLIKFSSLGPAIIKNDRLVVRIGGHYFPWEAAAPIILGMVAFDIENIFEPKGMIPIDQAEKTRAGDPSKAVIDSSGRWKLWPFSFKRSRTMKAIQPGMNGARSSDAENAPENTTAMDGDKNVLKPKDTRRKIRANSPTSEQLASLNLKEGKNTVTFTFSTAMLGKQQVEARIYLWKWNTRIVISDVDGTITKSDVLGQFMPLVGVDWSQTGCRTFVFSY
ncbi:hypothetical protein L1049_026489 [Liquidambar formosana]|uniref:phosphatidate phosphatase n=1 Tax=Liquidambar formosana TaxID=63359 RepID=A0AAP0NDH9_LIQFO